MWLIRLRQPIDRALKRSLERTRLRPESVKSGEALLHDLLASPAERPDPTLPDLVASPDPSPPHPNPNPIPTPTHSDGMATLYLAATFSSPSPLKYEGIACDKKRALHRQHQAVERNEDASERSELMRSAPCDPIGVGHPQTVEIANCEAFSKGSL